MSLPLLRSVRTQAIAKDTVAKQSINKRRICEECGLLQENTGVMVMVKTRRFQKEYCACNYKLPQVIKLPPVITSLPWLSNRTMLLQEDWQILAMHCHLHVLQPITFEYLMQVGTKNYELLNLRNHGLCYKWGLVLSKFIDGHHSVKIMDLSNNHLTGDGIDDLCNCLLSNDRITEVDLSGNNINSFGKND